MLARCSLCEKTFVTNQFGRQICPKCGREVFIADPRQPTDGSAENAYAPPRAATNPYVDSAQAGLPQGVPWENRDELGLWKALIETVKLALTQPSHLFTQIRPERTDGLYLYFFLVGVIPSWIAAILQRLLVNPADSFKQSIALYRNLGQEEMARGLEKFSEAFASLYSPGTFALMLLFTPIFSFIVLHFMAGVTHLVLKLAGKGSAGWNGTLSTFVYAYSPGFLNIIPSCGPLLMLTWMTGLQIVGLAKVQRISTGMATGAVLAFHGVTACLTCGIGAFIVAGILAAAGSHV